MSTIIDPSASSSASSSATTPTSASFVHPHPHLQHRDLPSSPSTRHSHSSDIPTTPSKRRIHHSTLADDDSSFASNPLTITPSSPLSSTTQSSPSSSSTSNGPIKEDLQPPSSHKKRQKYHLAQLQEEEGEKEALVPKVEMTSDGRQIKMLPHEYMQTDQEDLIVLIASMLVKLIRHNDQLPLLPEHLTRFHSRSPPSISVVDYLRRIVKYTNIEKSPLLLLLPYLDAFCQHLPSFTLSSLTVHRFLISSACVASKALCDSFCTNAHYAKVGGIRVEELNLLERELVGGLGWKLVVEGALLQDYYTSLIASHASSPSPASLSSANAPPILAYVQGPPSPPKPPPPLPSYLPWPSWEECEARFGRARVESHPLTVPD